MYHYQRWYLGPCWCQDRPRQALDEKPEARYGITRGELAVDMIRSRWLGGKFFPLPTNFYLVHVLGCVIDSALARRAHRLLRVNFPRKT